MSILVLYHISCPNVYPAGLINQFAWPVSLQQITWKTYIIFVIWDFFQTAVIYFFIPETKNRTVSTPHRFRKADLTNTLSIARGVGRNLRSEEPKKALYPKEKDGYGPGTQRRWHRKCYLVHLRSVLQLTLLHTYINTYASVVLCG